MTASYLSVSEFELSVISSENGKSYKLQQGEKILAEGTLDFCLENFFFRLKEQKKHALSVAARDGKSIKVTMTAR